MSDNTMRTITIHKADIADGGMKSYKQDDDSIILITRDDSTFYAFDGKCPHAGADLGAGLRCGKRVVCPWHHATFDSTDGALLEPIATEGLTQYELIDTGDSVVVNTAVTINKAIENNKLRDTHTIIVGGGAAGFMTAHQLRHGGYGGKITLINQEDKAPYNRPLLSKAFLAGDMPEEKLLLGGVDWAKNNNIDLRLSQVVREVLPNENAIIIEDGAGHSETLTADFLVVATGASAIVPPIQGAEHDSVYTLRSMDDARAIKAVSRNKNVVIVGTGFIGMEVAAALAQAGMTASITVVGQTNRVMQNIVSEAVSDALIQLHQDKGVHFVLNATVSEIVSEIVSETVSDGKQVKGVILADGTRLAADVVILGTGVAPRTELLAEVNDLDGVAVDRRLRLRDGVYALGDIAKADGKLGMMRIEHWRVAMQHGLVTAATILADDSVASLESRVPFFWTMQYGKSLRYTGHATTTEHSILKGAADSLNYIEYYFDDDGENTRASAASSLGRDQELIAFSELLRMGYAPTRAQIDADFDIIAQAHALSC